MATTALVTADRSMTNCGNKKCLYEMKTHISKHETFFCIVQRNPLHRSDTTGVEQRTNVRSQNILKLMTLRLKPQFKNVAHFIGLT